MKYNDIFVLLCESQSDGMVIRAEGIGDRATEAQLNLKSMNEVGHLYRGMTSAEYDNTVGAGNSIQSKGSFSFREEGTCFADNVYSAESYVDYGRDDPRLTDKPNYIVEVRHTDLFRKNRQGDYESFEPVPRELITRVWQIVPNADNELIAIQIYINQE